MALDHGQQRSNRFKRTNNKESRRDVTDIDETQSKQGSKQTKTNGGLAKGEATRHTYVHT